MRKSELVGGCCVLGLILLILRVWPAREKLSDRRIYIYIILYINNIICNIIIIYII